MATKLELTQLLATRNADLQAARLRISVLEGELALRPRSTPQVYAPRVYTPAAPTQESVDFRAKCALARARAMEQGKAVRV